MISGKHKAAPPAPAIDGMVKGVCVWVRVCKDAKTCSDRAAIPMHQHIEQLDLLNKSTSISAAIQISAHGALLEMATMQRLREKHGLIAVPALAARATPQTESVQSHLMQQQLSSSPKEESLSWLVRPWW
jgi:hypothetical protein